MKPCANVKRKSIKRVPRRESWGKKSLFRRWGEGANNEFRESIVNFLELCPENLNL